MSTSNQSHDRLLYVLAQQLKLPLLQIARQAELQGKKPKAADVHDIAQTAQAALQLIDAYVLSLQTEDQQLFAFEPVSVSAVLQQTAHQLEPLAKRYDCELTVHLSGRYGPVMADAHRLQTALNVLGQSFIEAQTDEPGKRSVLLAAHRSAKGLVAGVFDTNQAISTDMFRRARALYGSARQPFAESSASAAAGIFVADSLLRRMAVQLHVAHHHKLTGLAGTFLPSHQLELMSA